MEWIGDCGQYINSHLYLGEMIIILLYQSKCSLQCVIYILSLKLMLLTFTNYLWHYDHLRRVRNITCNCICLNFPRAIATLNSIRITMFWGVCPIVPILWFSLSNTTVAGALFYFHSWILLFEIVGFTNKSVQSVFASFQKLSIKWQTWPRYHIPHTNESTATFPKIVKGIMLLNQGTTVKLIFQTQMFINLHLLCMKNRDFSLTGLPCAFISSKHIKAGQWSDPAFWNAAFLGS